MGQEVFEGKVAVVTGGASGIGAALGREMGRRGAEVVVADRQVELAEEVAARIRGDGGRATAVELDVRSLESITAVVEATVARSGRIDLLFNNAGIGVAGEMDNYEPSDWDDVIDVNLRGVAYGVQVVYPRMVRQGSGHIVNTASVAGLVGAVGEGSYTATKHAVVGLSKSLRTEGRRHGVRVSVLCPGAIRTPIFTGGKYGRMNYVGLREEKMLELWSRMRPMEPDAFAQKALDAVARNEAIIVFPRWWRAFWYLDRISPAMSDRLWGAMLTYLRNEITASGARPISPAERKT